MKKWIRSYFGFSKTETNGFLILMPLMLVMIFSEPVFRWFSARSPQDFSADRRKLDSLVALWDQQIQLPGHDSDSSGTVLFSFNPNRATTQELQALGFSKGLSSRIANYRSRGGQFRVKSDLLKIYGMDSTLYQQLYGYIQLPDKVKFQEYKKYESKPASERRRIEKFDLNEADTAQLKKIYGIGEKLAVRIVRYRDKLGGFIRPDQAGEVYGLDSVVALQLLHASFIDPGFTPRLININTMSEKDLSSHPYISKTMAKAIVAYRFQHGKFKDPQEIRQIHSIRNEEADRIIPYLEIRE